jgi:hypothetical protein
MKERNSINPYQIVKPKYKTMIDNLLILTQKEYEEYKKLIHNWKTYPYKYNLIALRNTIQIYRWLLGRDIWTDEEVDET